MHTPPERPGPADGRRPRAADHRVPPGFWVKPGYLPEAVEVSGVMLSDHGFLRARVEVDPTLTEDDSIVGGFALPDPMAEDTEIHLALASDVSADVSPPHDLAPPPAPPRPSARAIRREAPDPAPRALRPAYAPRDPDPTYIPDVDLVSVSSSEVSLGQPVRLIDEIDPAPLAWGPPRTVVPDLHSLRPLRTAAILVAFSIAFGGGIAVSLAAYLVALVM